jgi:hypothetical protein
VVAELFSKLKLVFWAHLFGSGVCVVGQHPNLN